MNTVQNFIRKSGLKHGDMENRVDTLESVRKLEGKGMGSVFCKDLKGNLSESLWDGWVVWKNLALMKACSPAVKFGAGDKFTESRPGIIVADEVHCLILTGMSGEDVVMLVAENSELEVIGIGDVYETIVVEKSIGSD